jgi:hypothetical protein
MAKKRLNIISGFSLPFSIIRMGFGLLSLSVFVTVLIAGQIIAPLLKTVTLTSEISRPTLRSSWIKLLRLSDMFGLLQHSKQCPR